MSPHPVPLDPLPRLLSLPEALHFKIAGKEISANLTINVAKVESADFLSPFQGQALGMYTRMSTMKPK